MHFSRKNISRMRHPDPPGETHCLPTLAKQCKTYVSRSTEKQYRWISIQTRWVTKQQKTVPLRAGHDKSRSLMPEALAWKAEAAGFKPCEGQIWVSFTKFIDWARLDCSMSVCVCVKKRVDMKSQYDLLKHAGLTHFAVGRCRRCQNYWNSRPDRSERRHLKEAVEEMVCQTQQISR